MPGKFTNAVIQIIYQSHKNFRVYISLTLDFATYYLCTPELVSVTEMLGNKKKIQKYLAVKVWWLMHDVILFHNPKR